MWKGLNRDDFSIDQVLELMIESIQRGLAENQERVIFQQLRVAPESLIVHLAAFALKKNLEYRWPGRFRVQIEMKREDLTICSASDGQRLCGFEFKIPWSDGLIVREIIDDIEKKLTAPSTFEVTVFLRERSSSPGFPRRGGRYTHEDLKQGILDLAESCRPPIEVGIITESDPFILSSDEAEYETVIAIWGLNESHVVST